VLRPDQRAMVGGGDRLCALEDRDVLTHGQHGSAASNSACTTAPRKPSQAA
jgi:hypothetical protein